MTIENGFKQPPWTFTIGDETQGIYRKLAEGITTRVFTGDNVMLSVVKIEPNSTGTIHSHAEEQWGLLLQGKCVRIQGDEQVEMKEGDFWHTPGGTAHGIRTAEAGAVVLDIFSPPRTEYTKPGEGFDSSTQPKIDS